MEGGSGEGHTGRQSVRDGRKGSGEQGRWSGCVGGVRAKGGWKGHIHSSSFIFSPLQLLLLFAALKLDGGCTVGHSVVQYSGGKGVCGAHCMPF